MFRSTRITALALAVPAVAASTAFAAATLDLQGAATLRLVDATHAKVTFAVDDPIAGASKGAVQLGSVDRGSIKPDGRHGDDYKYTATFKSNSARFLEAGERYVVRIEAAGHATKRLRLKLVDAR